MKKKKILVGAMLASVLVIGFIGISNGPSIDCNTQNIIKSLANSTFSSILSANSAFAAGHDESIETPYFGEPIVLNLAGGG